jgi:hypothetical protein
MRPQDLVGLDILVGLTYLVDGPSDLRRTLFHG